MIYNIPQTVYTIYYIYHKVYMLPCSVLTSPPHRMVPPDPGPGHPPLGYARLLAFHICHLFPHIVEFLANIMQFNTTCNDYDSISQHSHQSTRTTGDAGAYIYHIVYIRCIPPYIYSIPPYISCLLQELRARSGESFHGPRGGAAALPGHAAHGAAGEALPLRLPVVGHHGVSQGEAVGGSKR